MVTAQKHVSLVPEGTGIEQLSYSRKCQISHVLVRGGGNPLRNCPENYKDSNIQTKQSKTILFFSRSHCKLQTALKEQETISPSNTDLLE